MEHRRLGSQGLVVSAQGLGCMSMSEFYGKADEAESVATIHRALELGISFFDTADVYGPHTNEQLVGKALAGRRSGVVLATKFGIVRTGDPKFRGVNGRPEYVRSSCEASLKRLGVEYIDLYYQHRVDTSVPIEETVGAMGELVRQGKIRYVGLSEASAATIRRAHRAYPVSVVQTEYSLWSRDCEDEVLPTVRELGIGFVAYSPLGRGFLTGAIKSAADLAADDFRRNSPRFQGDNFAKNLLLVERVKKLAGARGAAPGQFALAWVMGRGRDIVPIPGTTRRAHLEQNVAVAKMELTRGELAQIEEGLPKGAFQGTRYPEPMMKLING
jgi:aryl-alcohol dehydrogenase-like predicted oxidoreductase